MFPSFQYAYILESPEDIELQKEHCESGAVTNVAGLRKLAEPTQRRNLAKVVAAKSGELGQLPRKIISTEQSTAKQRFTNSELIYPMYLRWLDCGECQGGS